MRGYFGIGTFHNKTEHNIGTLWRSASQLGASFTFTINRRYTSQCSDTLHSWKHTPLYHYQDWDDFYSHLPYSCPVIGIEMGGRNLLNYVHPERCVYVLGAEDHGLSPDILNKCVEVISLPSVGTASYNVAVAGSLVMFDRIGKGQFWKNEERNGWGNI